VEIHFDPMDPGFREDPYPIYELLRRDDPVHRFPDQPLYAVSRYRDVLHVLRSPGVFSSAPLHMGPGGVPLGRDGTMTTTIIGSDGAAHDRLRALVNRTFAPRRILSLEGRIRTLARGLTDAFVGRGECELMADFAVPLPVIVIAELLGVPPQHQADFKRWSDAFVEAGNPPMTPERAARTRGCLDEFYAYFDEAVERRRVEPTDDLIGLLVRAEREGSRLERDEVLSFCLILLVAGNETTTNLIGNAVLALLEHGEALRKVRSNPHRYAAKAVEETLRYESPIQWLPRVALEDSEVAGSVVPKGAIVLPMYGAANRDETVFPRADEYDLARDPRGHLGFGFGAHFCLGAALARLEARVALEEILTRLPALERSDAPLARAGSVFLRGLARLPLRFEPACA
jgi:cytochrome P450